jgi:putative membrane protein
VTQLILRWLLNAIALFLVTRLIDGIQIVRFQDLFLAALAIGFMNAFIRPVIVLLTLPATLLSLGLFTLVINGFMFYLAANIFDGFRVTNFGTAFIAAILFSLFSFILNIVFKPFKN